MGRPRSFDEEQVLDAAGEVFERLGYEGTSVDDLVTAVGLHRGSLYKAFGSKRGLFLTCLRRVVDDRLPASLADGQGDLADRPTLDLVLVAALELAGHDDEARTLVREATALLGDDPAPVLGRRLLARARLAPRTTTPVSRRPR